MDLASLDEALSALAACEPSELGDRSTIVGLERQLWRLEAIVARAAGGLAAREDHEIDGARGAARWLASSCRLPLRVARAQVARGRALRSLPVAEAAFQAGEIGPAQVGLLAALEATPATHDALVEAEALLVEKARELSFASFKRACAYAAQLADPDGAEARAEAMRARRDVYLVESFEGSFIGGIRLDPIAGAIVAGELARLEKGLFDGDWRAAKERCQGQPRTDDLARTSAQRRADALVEMARRSAACPEGAPSPAPLVSVLVDFPTLSGRICELANGTVVSPGSVLPYLDEALVERAVWRSPTRVEVGAKTRFFSGATRRAIELRDRVCQHPYCEEPVSRCEVDHILPASRNGPTTQENGRLACRWHNRARNRGMEWPAGRADRSPPGAPG